VSRAVELSPLRIAIGYELPVINIPPPPQQSESSAESSSSSDSSDSSSDEYGYDSSDSSYSDMITSDESFTSVSSEEPVNP